MPEEDFWNEKVWEYGYEVGRDEERQRIKSELKERNWNNLTQKEILKIIEGENDE